MEQIKLFEIVGTSVRVELNKCGADCPAWASCCEYGDVCSLFDPFDVTGIKDGFPQSCKLPELKESELDQKIQSLWDVMTEEMKEDWHKIKPKLRDINKDFSFHKDYETGTVSIIKKQEKENNRDGYKKSQHRGDMGRE